MIRFYSVFLCSYLAATVLHAQTHSHGRTIQFPDVPGYLTLTCDFHQHTVFSDGDVWPNIRVQEAVKDSVDAISLTEHLEYQPHSDDMPHPDRNRSYEIAEKAARPYTLLVIRGAEITRDMPPGHNNAIFIQDANKLRIEAPVPVFEEANRQGAFVFWNHPDWIAQREDGIARLTPMHEELIRRNLLHGIEVVNDLTYSEEALQIALDKNLTIMATSDIHGLIDWQYKVAEGGHRPVTLVFAKERTPASIKEALFERRTVAWYNNLLVGRPEHLNPLLQACLRVEKARYIGPSSVCEVVVYNDSDADFLLFSEGPYSLQMFAGVIELPAHARTTIPVKTLEVKDSFELNFKVLNAVTAPGVHPELKWEVKPGQ